MKNILIVDDHPIIRMSLETIVRKVVKECRVFHCSTLQETKSILLKHRFDLMILDLSIPGSVGTSMIPALRKLSSNTPILVCSGRDEDFNAPHCITMGANGYVPKTASNEETETAVRHVLENKTYLRPHVQAQIMENFLHRKPLLPNPVESLTPREKEVLELLITGIWTKEIAKQLNLKFSTVSTHKARILEKMGVENTVELYKKFEEYTSELKTT
ncbi:response regulator transcription factor [Dyadobacter diqingensis]|uniref:response regulator transcription factor n=1 Tax=Dyadobacter diqingensis TaxID=2938121 RepID=UPI0020C1D8A0|nr:response regulator transcription factor [Dyadobacter diqingensis]